MNADYFFFFKANRKLNCPHMMADGFMFVHFRLRSPLSRSNTIGEGYSDGQPMENQNAINTKMLLLAYRFCTEIC